jgi:ATP-dependent Clp protease protease subunit
MNRFWNITGNRLEINGVIASESWWGDEVTPKLFKDELAKVEGDLTVSINSQGGDVFAAVEIYNALKSHKGKVTVYIDSLAASAATIIMCAGEVVQISPAACIMIHNPLTMAMGDFREMEKAKNALEEIKGAIINAYMLKTGLSSEVLSKMMDEETWMSAHRAKGFGFVDEILEESVTNKGGYYSRQEVINTGQAVAKVAIDKMKSQHKKAQEYEKYKQIVKNLI